MCVYTQTYIYIKNICVHNTAYIICKNIYFKELIYVIMEADNSQELQSRSWRPRGANGVAPVKKTTDSRHRRSQCFSMSPKAGKKIDVPAQRQLGRRNFLLLSHFVLFKTSTDWTRPTYIRESNLLYSVYQFNCQCHPETPSQAHPK